MERLLPMQSNNSKVPTWQWDDRKPVADNDAWPPQVLVVHWPVCGGPASPTIPRYAAPGMTELVGTGGWWGPKW